MVSERNCILFLMDYAAPYPGNFIPSILNLKEHVNNIGLNVVLLFPQRAEQLDWVLNLSDEGIKVLFIENTFLHKKIKISHLKSFVKILKSEKVSIVHTHFVATNYNLFLIKKFLYPRVKIFGNFMNHFNPPHNKYRRFKIFILRNSFDFIIGSSDSVSSGLIEIGFSKNRVCSITNALDIYHLNTFDNISLSKLKGKKHILMFGWPYMRKGVDLVIDALSILNKDFVNYTLSVAMAGGHSLAEAEIKTKLGGIPDWINLLPPRKDIASYYNAADVFISSSREEGYTYAVLEAAYSNSMIIVSKIGGNPQDIPYTFIYEVYDVDKLKSLIIEATSIPLDEKQMINEAQRKYVSSTYDVNNWSEKIIDQYSIFIELSH